LNAVVWGIRPRLSKCLANAVVGIRRYGQAVELGGVLNEIGCYPSLAQGRDNVHSRCRMHGVLAVSAILKSERGD